MNGNGAIETSGLAKSFGDVVAVKSVTFSVHPGELFGFLGPNGAGKTTTINMLTGLARAAGFAAFPMAIVGAMMLLVGIGLVEPGRDLQFNGELLPVAVTVLGSVALNMAVGFAVGLTVHYVIFRNPEGPTDAP